MGDLRRESPPPRTSIDARRWMVLEQACKTANLRRRTRSSAGPDLTLNSVRDYESGVLKVKKEIPGKRMDWRTTRIAVVSMALVLMPLLGPGRALATWSIVAVDPDTHEVGVAVASCVSGVSITPILVPGKGAFIAQAMSNLKSKDVAARLMANGSTADEVLARVLDPTFDPEGRLINFGEGGPTGFIRFFGSNWRQYGVATLSGDRRTASFTGRSVPSWCGSAHDDRVSVQGNILRSGETVAEALKAFERRPPACVPTLADRLMSALLAGAAAGGDRRCTKQWVAHSAYLAVAQPGDRLGEPSLSLTDDRQNRPGSVTSFLEQMAVEDSGDGGASPVVVLRNKYVAWAAQHRNGTGACLTEPNAPWLSGAR